MTIDRTSGWDDPPPTFSYPVYAKPDMHTPQSTVSFFLYAHQTSSFFKAACISKERRIQVVSKTSSNLRHYDESSVNLGSELGPSSTASGSLTIPSSKCTSTTQLHKILSIKSPPTPTQKGHIPRLHRHRNGFATTMSSKSLATGSLHLAFSKLCGLSARCDGPHHSCVSEGCI